MLSDIYYDGAATTGDLARYVLDWFAQHAVADTNMDGVVAQADLTRFLTAYAQGG